MPEILLNFFASKHNSNGDYEIEFVPANMRAVPTVTRLANVMFGGESSTSVSSIGTHTADIMCLRLVLINSSDANCGG